MKKVALLLLVGIILSLKITSAYAAAPEQLSQISSGYGGTSYIEFNNELYFTAVGGNYGYELRKTDGTSGGTVLVKDIYVGSNDSSPSGYTVVNETLFFSAAAGGNWSSNRELWKTDGTTLGTVLVKEIKPTTTGNSAGSNPSWLSGIGTNVYFTADNGTSGLELWKSDGTDIGTVMVKDINIGMGDGVSTSGLTVMNDILYFMANDGTNGYELWKSDGTSVGTVLLKDINTSGNSYGGKPFVHNGAIYFQATDGANGYELWKSDGTAEGTVLLKNINPIGDSSPQYFVSLGTTLFFSADDGTHGVELWKSDGTTEGTVLVKDINPSGSNNGGVSAAYDGKLFFTATDGIHGYELWKTDGSTNGTTMVKDIMSNGDAGSWPSSLVVYDNHLYFTAGESTYGYELWSTSGTSGSTEMMEDMYTGGSSSDLMSLRVFGSNLYYFAFNGSATYFWKYSAPTPAAPDEPTNLNVNPFGETVGTIRWTEPSNNYSDITNYFVSYRTGEGAWTEINTGSTATARQLTGLTLGLTYEYKVKAVNAIGESAYSEPSTFTTATPGTLEAPTSFVVNGEEFTVTPQWGAPAHTAGYALTAYRLEYKSLEGDWESPIYAETKNISEAFGAFELPDFETTYQFRVAAINANGDTSPYSTVVEFRTPDMLMPDVITALGTESVGPTFATLLWEAPFDHSSPITDYVISYRPAGGSFVVVNTESNDTAYNLMDLTVDTVYEFKVKAINDGGESTYSELASFTTRALGAPTSLVAVANGTSALYFNLSWTPPENNGGSQIFGYKIEYKLSTESWDNLLSSFSDYDAINSLEEIGLLQYGTTYDIRIYAINDEITGPASAVVHYTTPAATVHYIKNCTTSTDEEDLGLQGIAFLGSQDNYFLANSIDCSLEEFTPISFDGDPFMGVFDGQTFTITNLSHPGAHNVGLFDTLESATIKNLNMTNTSEFTLNAGASGFVGALAGVAYGNVTIDHVVTNLDLNGNGSTVGGLIATYFDINDGQLKISNSEVKGNIVSVAGDSSAGGLVDVVNCSYQDYKKCVVIENSLVSGNISGTDSIGGLIGYYYDEISKGMSINNSSFTGDFIESLDNGDSIGGLLGSIYTLNALTTVTITNSHTSGEISGQYNIGGIVGYFEESYGGGLIIEDCYSTMNVTGGSQLGGLLGVFYTVSSAEPLVESRIVHSYATGDVISESEGYNVGGLAGSITDDASGYGAFTVSRSFATGDVEAGSAVGGLVGFMGYGKISIENSYARGNVSGIDEAGGLVGRMYGGNDNHLVSINTSYASGSVYGAGGEGYIGGLVGYISNHFVSITNSYSSGLVSTDGEYVIMGGLIGSGTDNLVFINNYYDQTGSGQEECLGEGDYTSIGCTSVNISGDQSTYFYNNNTAAPLNKWPFTNIWIKNVGNHPTLKTQALTSDKAKPVITLVGAASVEVTSLGTYVDAGATATDNVDGNVTSHIVTTTNLDMNKVGEYVVMFDVCDAAGNCANRISRTVSIPQLRITGRRFGYLDTPQTLVGVVIDTENYVACSWSQTSGAGVLTFSNPNSLTTTVTGNQLGTYGIHLECPSLDEGFDSAVADIQYHVYFNGDLNNDLKVDNDDFTLLMSNWGNSPTNPMADYTQDGIVNNDDFTILMYWWGNHNPT